jgi:hypothetical protein
VACSGSSHLASPDAHRYIPPDSSTLNLYAGFEAHTGRHAPPDLNTGDEAAAAKLWSVYISEAEKYDKALVESWKSNMGGMLIFVGGFLLLLT